jgi:alpha-mannosidase
MSLTTEALTSLYSLLQEARAALTGIPLTCDWRVAPGPLSDRLAEEIDTTGWPSCGEWFASDRWSPGDTWMAATVRVPAQAAGVRLAGSAATVNLWGWNPFTLWVDGQLLEQEPTVWYATGPAQFPLPQPVPEDHTYRFVLRLTTPVNGLFAGLIVSLGLDALTRILEEIEAFQAELQVAEALAQTQEHRAALGQAVAAVDREALRVQDWEPAIASFRAAEACLAPLSPLAKSHTVHLIGHSHIDMNWMWTWPDTVDVTRRDFRSVLALMREFPELTFTHSQVSTYQIIQEQDPELFSEVRQRIAEGRWEPVASTWVEGDLNMANGESIARHFLYAIRWSRENLGVTPRVLWEPDTFGHPANIPQLARQAGLERYFHMRCNPGLPDWYPVYWWEGLDGSRILVASRVYNGEINASSVVEAMLLHRKFGSRVSFHLHGLGDHGGGPVRAQLRTLARLQQRPLLPTLVCSTMEAYGTAALQEGAPIPEVRGESETVFEGCYTTHADIKRYNREGENLLLTAEALGALAGTDDRQGIGQAWQRVLFNQFHDLLDGSSITPAYADCARDHERVKSVAAEATDRALAALAERADTRGEGEAIVVVNPTGFLRTDLVRVRGLKTHPERPLLVGPEGRTTPGQWVGEELLFVAHQVPSLGYAVYHLKEADGGDSSSSWRTDLRVQEQEQVWEVETPAFRVRVGKASGILHRFFDKRAGRELVAYGEPKWGTYVGTTRSDLALNVFQFCQEPPHGMTAWLIDSLQSQRNLLSGATVSLAEAGPVRVVLHVEHSLGRSRLSQDILFYRDLDRVDFPTVVDWQEVGTPQAGVPLLKVAFTARLSRAEATYEVPYGAVSRPADGQEVPALRWADVSEEGYGFSLLNDCKYGYDALGSRLRLTLIRCAYDPDRISDQGEHRFSYSLVPHLGTWRDAHIVTQAIGFNQPLLAQAAEAHAGEAAAYAGFTVSGLPSVVLSAVKMPEEGPGWIVRLYESAGRAGTATLSGARPFTSAEAVNLLEETQAALPVHRGAVTLAFRPWEVKTLRVQG